MSGDPLPWLVWALLSAAFAALTAVFAKVGVESVNSDYATFVRTVVIVIVLGGILWATGAWQAPGTVSTRTWVFLILSGLATGASWLCYFRALKLGDAARVAPVDKLSVLLVAVFATMFLGEKLSGPNWAGILLIAAGTVLVAYRDDHAERSGAFDPLRISFAYASTVTERLKAEGMPSIKSA